MQMSDATPEQDKGSGLGSGTETAITHDEAIAWLNGYKQAWESRDVDAALALFAPDVQYRERRFKQPLKGLGALKSYFRDRVMEHQRDITYDFELWGVRDNQLMARWTAAFTWLPINGNIEMDGVCNVLFARREDGGLICVEYNEWFDQTEV